MARLVIFIANRDPDGTPPWPNIAVGMPNRDCFTEIKWSVCELKLTAIDHLDSAHKSGDAWVSIASSVQAWIEVYWKDPQRLEPIRIPAHLIPINAPPAEDRTLEAMRTQACDNQCIDFKGLLFAARSPLGILPGHIMKRAIVFRIFCKGNSISINGTMGISDAAARTTSALSPKGKNLILFTVS
jgi:hypothetical protein